MTGTETFRVEDGVPVCDGKEYRWAAEVHHNPPRLIGGRMIPGPYDGFTLLLENGWEVHVMWANYEDRGWPEFQPSREVASVEASVAGLMETLSRHDPTAGEWPYQPFDQWFMGRRMVTTSDEIDRYVASVATLPMAPWVAAGTG